MGHFSSVEYIEFDGASFFTVVLLPQKEGTFPTVIFRTPYVQATVEMSDEDVKQNCLTSYMRWLDRGYAVVFQHCRGQGKSSGAFVPYIHEREDGFALRKWIRNQPFYNGEIFLCGGSYGASLHYSTSPFERDVFVKGQIKAALAVSSNCFDTSFYMCVSIQKPQGDYVLRHDITSLGYQLGEYTPNSEVVLNFCFDEYAFLLKKGEHLRIDIAPTDNNTYVCHTNQNGPYCLQTKSVIAQNKIDLSRSVIVLPVEE